MNSTQEFNVFSNWIKEQLNHSYAGDGHVNIPVSVNIQTH